MERIEDRLLLSAAVRYEFFEDGFVDIRKLAGNVTVEGAWTAVVFLDVAAYHPDSAPSGRYSPSTGGISGFEPEAAGQGGIAPLRLGPDDPTSPASQRGLIDFTLVINERVAPEATRPQVGNANVARNADGRQPQEELTGEGSLSGDTAWQATLADRHAAKSYGRRPDALNLEGSEAPNAPADPQPGGQGLSPLRGSPFGPIDGARGICHAFDLAASDPHQEKSDSCRGGSIRLASSPFAASKAGHAAPGTAPNRPGRPIETVPTETGRHPLASLTLRDSDDRLAVHEAALSELSDSLADPDLDAVYLDVKRPAEATPLVAALAVSHYLATRKRDPHNNPHTLYAYPRPPQDDG